MLVREIVQAAIPNADERVIDMVLWGRTPYPFGRVDARMIYQAADRMRRAGANQRRLCDFCNRQVFDKLHFCQSCTDVLEMASKTSRSNGLEGRRVNERRLGLLRQR